MKVWGVLEKHELGESIISLKKNGKRTYYYLRKNMVKKFAKYLRPGVKVCFEREEEMENHHNVFTYPISSFYQICKKTRHGLKIYYDSELIKQGIRDIVNKEENLLFIDFEMNMQDYVTIPHFTQEIIEAGYVLTNNSLAIRKVEHYYIKPTQHKKITTRTLNFLNFPKEVFKSALTFKQFYAKLVDINNEYHPSIYVWGKSDISQLKRCCEINKVEFEDFKFIDLMQLHVNYFNYKAAPGLFHTLEEYNQKPLPEQAHDSLEDAMVTKEVFRKFREKINKDIK